LKTAILIDDDFDDLSILESIIASIDSTIRCHCFSDTVDALTFLAREGTHRIDYVFTDYNMPKMNGIEVIKEIISMGRYDSTVFAVVSSCITGLADRLQEFGVTNVFEKSPSGKELGSMIGSVLSKGR